MDTSSELQKLLDENRKLKQELRNATKISSLLSVIINTIKRTFNEAVHREKKLERLEKENQNLQKQLEKAEDENNITKAIMFASQHLDNETNNSQHNNINNDESLKKEISSKLPQTPDDIVKMYFGPIDIDTLAQSYQNKDKNIAVKHEDDSNTEKQKQHILDKEKNLDNHKLKDSINREKTSDCKDKTEKTDEKPKKVIPYEQNVSHETFHKSHEHTTYDSNVDNIKNNDAKATENHIDDIYVEEEMDECEVPDVCTNIESIFNDTNDFNDDDII